MIIEMQESWAGKEVVCHACGFVSVLQSPVNDLAFACPSCHGYLAWDGTRRRWRYSDDERPQDARCYDCARPYASIGDCVVPNEVWERINPTGHKGAGILCANCIIERLHVVGVAGVEAKLW